MSNIITLGEGLKGRYKFGKICSITGKVTETEWIDNVLTDYGVNYLFNTETVNYSAMLGYCQVGTSSTTPTQSDTQCISPLGPRIGTGTLEAQGNAGAATYYCYRRVKYSYAIGNVVGNVAEVCIHVSSTGPDAVSRALVKDTFGVPTTFPVLITEQLYVIYEIRSYPNLVDTTGSIVLNSISYDYTIRSCNVTGLSSLVTTNNGAAVPTNSSQCEASDSNTLQPVTSEPGGARANPDALNTTAYSNGTFYKDKEFVWNPPTAVFGTGMGSILIRTYTAPAFQFALYFTSGKVPKLNTQTLKLKFRFAVTRL